MASIAPQKGAETGLGSPVEYFGAICGPNGSIT